MSLTFTPEFLAKYSDLTPLGQGGMGTVYRGVQRSLERPVAIKFLSRQLLDDEFLARFTAEARLAGQVFHTNLVAVIEFGLMGDVPFIVFELVEGASLREHVKLAGGSIALAEALDIVRQAAEGLAIAHGIGIVHRDIKPENILVGTKGVKVADFGVAKSAAASSSQKTRSGVIMGTPAYMSPEQAREQPVTPACDVYALGVVLYELVAGALPFQKQNTLELLQAIVSEPPPPLSPTVPPLVADLTQRMLAKDPRERPASMADCARELARCVAEVGAGFTAALPGAAAATRPVSRLTPPPLAQTVASHVTQPQPRRGRVALAAGAAVVLIVGAFVATGRTPPPPSVRATASAVRASAEPDADPMSLMDHDQVLSRFCASSPRAEEMRICKAWEHLKRHDVVAASRDLFEKQRMQMPQLSNLRRNFRDGNTAAGGMRNMRVFERLVTELFALPRAEGLKAAAELDTIAASGLMTGQLAGLADLASGGTRLPEAFRNLKSMNMSALLGGFALPPRGSGLQVLVALALAASLPPGWGSDKSVVGRVATAQGECETYLRTWVRGELRPVAAELAIAFAEARGLPPDPKADLTDLAPELRARMSPRLSDLLKIARRHVAAYQPGTMLSPDPAY